MPPESMSLDDFMSHSTTASKGSFLKKWRERRPIPPSTKPVVNTVLLMQNSIYCIGQHNFPRIHIEKETGVKKVWGGNYVCHENEKLIRDQYRRDEEDRRLFPATKCGGCKLVEWTYQSILDGKIKWTDPVFRFEASDPKETRTIHAGGLCNMFGKKDMSPEDKADLKEHGIYQKSSWAENCLSKLKYVFIVVDFDDPAAGVQIAIESSSLGSAVRGVIFDRRTSKGQDEGNPFLHPFVIQWEYDPSESTAFGDKYHARPIERAEYDVTKRPDIMALVAGTPPDVSNIIRPFNHLELRTALEEAALIEFPWDECFGKVEDQPQAPPPGRQDAPGRTPEVKTGTTAAVAAKKPTVVYTDDDPACEKCDKPVKDADLSCPHCGFIFVAEAAPPPPPVRRKRTAGAQAPAAAKQIAKPSNLSSGPGGSQGAPLPGDDEDVPFVYCDVATIGERWWR